eukprot:gene27422-36069_t
MSDFVENIEQEIQGAFAAAERRERAQSRCSVCKSVGHNKRNCPQNNIAVNPAAQRVGSRPVTSNGNMRELEPRDLRGVEAGNQDNSSIGSNMESDNSDDDEEDLPTVWVDVDVEDAPDDDPERIEVPEFTPYPEFAYGPTGTYDVLIAEDHIDTMHNWVILAFEKMFSSAMIDSFVTATNSYGNFGGTSTWKDTDAVEMKAFFGVILYLGICKYPTRRMAWSAAEGSAKLRGMMSKKRFEQILAYWHYTDFTTLSKPEMDEIKKKDPFWAVSDFCVHLADRFEQAWNPGQDLDIDEQCCPFKGRHRSRCYNPKKPEKWHFKNYALNCSKSGYLLNYRLYQGASEERPPGMSATAFPIHVLLEHNHYWHRNHILFTDNWYTSFQSSRICIERGLHMVGTIKANRKGLPPAKLPGQPKPPKMVRGQSITKKATYGGRDVYLTLWQDRKPVRIFHSIKTFRGMCRRQVKDNRTKVWGRMQFYRPTIVPKYNGSMGATDVGDQLAAAYRTRLKTLSWIPRIFTHFLGHATVNMYVIAKFIRSKPNQEQIVKNLIPAGHLNFRLCLIDALTKPYLLQRVLHEAPVVLESKSKNLWEADFSRLSGAHFPVQEHTKDDQRFEGKKRPRNEGSNVRNWVRGYCKICDKLIPTSCESCRVFLCIGNDSNTITCWKRFHTCRKITNTIENEDEDPENDWEDAEDNSE